MWPIPGIGKSSSSVYRRYDYDANGNLTSAGSYGAFTWNAENRLSSATKNGVTEKYGYDVDGARITETVGITTTRVFFPGVYEEEVSGSTTTAIKHYSFNGMTIAVRRGGVLRYTHTDHLGSTSGQTDASGNGVNGSYTRFYAYGSLRVGDPTTLSTDRTFTGQKADGTGLLYYNARYYDPALGTFLSPDTLVPDAGRVIDYNRFLYVRGNPMKYSDPSGHCALLDNGSADRDGDGACWDAADEWFGTFEAGNSTDRTAWEKSFAGLATITEDVLRAGLHQYCSPLYNQWGVYHPRYNPVPTLYEPPAHPVNAVARGVRNSIGQVCDFWDCPAIGLDITSLGISIAQTGAVACTATGVGAPACAPSAAYLTLADVGVNVSAIGYDSYQYAQGNATLFDLTLTVVDSGKSLVRIGNAASVTPGVGIAYDAFMLAYDLFVDPFITTPGGLRVAQ